MTPEELRALADAIDAAPAGTIVPLELGSSLARLCAELAEALKAIGEVAFVAHEGDPWYAEHEGIDAEIAFAKYRAVLAKLAELEAP